MDLSNKKKINITVYGRALELYIDSDLAYAEGGQAIVLRTSSGAPELKLTVNIPELDALEDGEFCVKTWSENEPYIEPLLKTGAFIDTEKRFRTGHVIGSIWKLAE